MQTAIATPPRTRSLELSADTLTPVAAALRLGVECAFLLESVEEGARYGRYSLLGVHGRTLEVRGDHGVLIGPNDRHEVAANDPLEALRGLLPPATAADDPDLALYAGVGYLAYEVAARWERVPVPEADPLDMPDAVFHLPSTIIVFDHLAQVARLATLDDADAGERLQRVADVIGSPIASEVPAPIAASGVPPEADEAARHRFEAGVQQLVDEIHAGEMLQAVIARRFSVRTERTPIEIYRSLRRINPSPYLYYLDLTSVAPGAALVGASPELLVRVSGSEVVTRPIAGTRPRHEDPGEDAGLEAELRADPKELAEHAMLVDLARNDVGRVAAPASVEVTSLREVERYRHVMHLVSEVQGELRPELDAFDAVRALFPAGTLSGAPKVRAMQAIAEIEGERRGPYGGAVGYFSPHHVECAITIRSAVIRDGVASVHAGAGIVADSTPQREAAEVAAKAASMLAAIGAGKVSR
ncbi:MAG TPA: anthranilate synthase component I family protein [Candidatus Limnocylindria bacterium]|nr:anthranilate synthase component I family protein [Candidatus Limnocylindria bacterium]